MALQLSMRVAVVAVLTLVQLELGLHREEMVVVGEDTTLVHRVKMEQLILAGVVAVVALLEQEMEVRVVVVLSSSSTLKLVKHQDTP
jgi:hypothetical protein